MVEQRHLSINSLIGISGVFYKLNFHTQMVRISKVQIINKEYKYTEE